MSTVVRWGRRYPFAEFDTAYRTAFGPATTRDAGFTPSAEVVRDGQDALVRVEVPGLDPEHDVAVEVVGNRLVVRGERKDERSGESHGRTLREVRYGAFRRGFTLPAHVTGDDVTATYDQGVLTVRVAGVHTDATTRRIPVSAGTPAAAGEAGDGTVTGAAVAGDVAGEAAGEQEKAA